VPSASESSRSDISDDFSSSGGDLLQDEIDQVNITTQAVEHVAILIARAKGSNVAEIVKILEESMTEHTETERGIINAPTLVSASQQQNRDPREGLAKRRKIDDVSKETKHLTPYRPFSFFEGDDNDRVVNTRGAALSRSTSQRSLSLPLSMIPSPVLDHSMARPRREDSTSSLNTCFQRSPQPMPRTPSSASSRMSCVTTVRKSSAGVRMIAEINNMRNKSTNGESE
jgi:hypothetical protein